MNITDKYEIINNTENDTSPIRLIQGKFINFVYKYGAVKVGSFEEDDVPVTFEYDLLEAPTSYITEDEDAEKIEFENLIGDILVDIIINSKDVKETNGNRNNNTK